MNRLKCSGNSENRPRIYLIQGWVILSNESLRKSFGTGNAKIEEKNSKSLHFKGGGGGMAI